MNNGLAGSTMGCAGRAVHRAQSRRVVGRLARDLDQDGIEAEAAGRVGRRVGLLTRGRIEQQTDAVAWGSASSHQLDALGSKLDLAHQDAGDVGARPGQACDVALGQRIEVDGEKRDRRRSRDGTYGAQRRLTARRQEDVDLARGEFAKRGLVALDARRLLVFEGEIPAFVITEFGHAAEEGFIERRVTRLDTDKANAQHLGDRLRPRDARVHQRRSGGG